MSHEAMVHPAQCVLVVKACRGKLVEEFEGGRNAWKTAEALEGQKVYASFATELAVALGKHRFIEETHSYHKQEF